VTTIVLFWSRESRGLPWISSIFIKDTQLMDVCLVPRSWSVDDLCLDILWKSIFTCRLQLSCYSSWRNCGKQLMDRNAQYCHSIHLSWLSLPLGSRLFLLVTLLVSLEKVESLIFIKSN
jgi:hypothetical protein